MSDMRFFSGRPIKGEEKQENGLIKVVFSDEKKPESELVSEDEFKTYVVTREVESQPTEIEKNRQLGLQKATYALQGRIMKEVEGFNPRWIELGRVVTRINDASMDVRDKLFNSLFEVGSWQDDVKFGDVLNKLKNPVWEGAPDEVKAFFGLLAQNNMKVAEFEVYSNAVKALVSAFQKQLIEQEFDRPYETIRLSDIVNYIEAHPVKSDEPQPNT